VVECLSYFWLYLKYSAYKFFLRFWVAWVLQQFFLITNYQNFAAIMFNHLIDVPQHKVNIH